jgi:hypothetical protein
MTEYEQVAPGTYAPVAERSVRSLIEEREAVRRREDELTEQIEHARAVDTLARALHARYGVEDFEAEGREWRIKGARLRDYGFCVDDIPRLAQCFEKAVPQ